MVDSLQQTLDALADPALLRFNRGIERESLRVDPQGNLARTPHPEFLGSKLCHPSITTDFSEAQLELITAVNADVEQSLAELSDIFRFVHSGLGDEVMWSASMPCVLQGDNDIPLAQYGTSNLGRLKTTYRSGLGYRYGRSMQTICAVHYNLSFNDALWSALANLEGEASASSGYRSRRYFDLMRNFRRLSWLPVYLFGASPAVCNSFVQGREHDLVRFDEGSLYARGATSLRNGSLGYNSNIQRGLVRVCYNSLENYVMTLADAICTPHEDYVKIGTVRGGEHLQVNTNILQSEAEFYSTIRAKCTPPKGSNFLEVLLQEGVEYVEVRLLDVNPYEPLGIDAVQMRFLDMLLLYCLLTDSPEHDDATCDAVTENVQRVVYGGRAPYTNLDDMGSQRSMREWGVDIVRDMQAVADTLDSVHGDTTFNDSLEAQHAKLLDPDLTPSARVLQDMREQSIPFFRFAMNKSLEHQAHFREVPLSPERVEHFKQLAERSRIDQRTIEDSDQVGFERYLEQINREYRDLLP